MAEQLAAWQIPVLPQLIEQAKNLYQDHHQAIMRRAQQPPEVLRAEFLQFADLDEQYFMECEEIFPKVYSYVRTHFVDFEALLTYQAA